VAARWGHERPRGSRARLSAPVGVRDLLGFTAAHTIVLMVAAALRTLLFVVCHPNPIRVVAPIEAEVARVDRPVSCTGEPPSMAQRQRRKGRLSATLEVTAPAIEASSLACFATACSETIAMAQSPL
jgi:hypothetical protein